MFSYNLITLEFSFLLKKKIMIDFKNHKLSKQNMKIIPFWNRSIKF